ncbi:MAG TPA: HDOD domain-containing protein [Phycisphaerales bacterium]|nr:HDOD domain-containing protein [Phycisphaerales bacterium]
MHQTIEKILSCSTLPTLPAVAVQIIEMTSDPDASLKDLARVIQNDQGLAAKIIKTVNSSFYGLRRPCASIDKALVLLGLSPVKSLALGFSLVQSVSEGRAGSFDYRSYWRRGLLTAVASRLLAVRVGLDFGDEVFLGGLLQDIGMVAMHRALGAEYDAVLGAAGGKHRELVRQELAMLDLQHPDIGAMLAQRWRMPQELFLPVRFHERPSAAPAACVDHVRCVGLGNLVHDVLSEAEPGPALRQLYERGGSWYGLESGEVDEIIRCAGEGAKEISGLFKLDIGGYADADAVLAEAGRRAIALVRLAPGESSVLSSASDCSALAGSDFDPLTGAVGPRGFESAIREGFRSAVEHGEPLALVEAVIDRYAGLVGEHGEGSDIEAVMGVTALLKRTFEGQGGVVCRIGPERFVVVLPSTGRLAARVLAEAFLDDLDRVSPTWTSPSESSPMRVTTTLGVAALDEDTRGVFTEARTLVLACARAMQAGVAAGGATLRVFQARSAAA